VYESLKLRILKTFNRWA